MQKLREGSKWLLQLRRMFLFFLVLSAAFLLQPGNSILAFGASGKSESSGKSASSNIIYFANDHVEAGVPLKVMNAPRLSTFRWTITGADGSERKFTTKDNSYTPEEADREKLITVTLAGNKGKKASIYFSSLPVIYIRNTDGYYDIGDDFSDASMCMQGNKAFSSQSQLYSGDIRIKLRGNSTRLRDKRPFNIKLEEKTDLLGMGKNKHWALLANDIDHTMMRNKLLYDFSGDIGMDTYCKSENVVLIFNQEYYGVYQLCELVNLGSSRVDIYDWEEAAENAAEAVADKLADSGDIPKEHTAEMETRLEEAMCEDLSWITAPYQFSYDIDGNGKKETFQISDYIKLPDATGGALLEMDFYNFSGNNPSPLITAYSQPLYFKSPEYAVTDAPLYHYIEKYIQSFEYSLHSTDFIYHDKSLKYNAINRKGGSSNPGYRKSSFTAPEYDGKHYSELFDMDSLVQNFLVCEYSMNWDSMKNSVFLYKDTDGLFHMGPEWDFDWAWGNINMFETDTWYPTSWQTTEKAFTCEQYYQTVQWNRCLIRDPYFLVRVYEKYQKIRRTIIEDMIKDGGTIDTYAKELEKPAAANDARWGYSYKEYNSVSFHASVKNLKEYINTRVSWLDQQFSSIETLIASLGYYKPDDELKIIKVDTKRLRKFTTVTVQLTNPDIAAVAFQINGRHIYQAKVTSGFAVCRIPDSALVREKDVLNVVQVLAENSAGKYIISSKEKGNYNQAKSNYAVFYRNGKYEAGSASQALETFQHGLASGSQLLLITILVILAFTGIGIVFAIRYHKK